MPTKDYSSHLAPYARLVQLQQRDSWNDGASAGRRDEFVSMSE